ncbi:hypothetical protein CSQ94_20475 [Janthinobacterium sp. BJB312]|nr:hypothetical protein CSQ94_20475 [Janthinobacterium sp. BJB312]
MVPIDYAGRYVYHFSHIDNLEGLVKNGFLSTNHPSFPTRHHSIAASSIQQRRAEMEVPCGPGGRVHDYVPCYFGSCSPMLLNVLHTKNIDQCDILYFEFPIDLVTRLDSVFTSASANTGVPPQFYSDPADLKFLDWGAIDSLKWGNPDDDYRHRRMAELLVHNNLPVYAATRCIVWNDDVKKNVEKIVNGSKFPKIEFESPYRRHYYKNLELKDNSTLIKGPGHIAAEFCEAYENVVKHVEKKASSGRAKFDDLNALLEGLRTDFGCISHTSELVGLNSANGMHKQTVDMHTKDVVQRLLNLPEYAALDKKCQDLAEIAVYLHDIGKGPRSRWVSNGGLQKVDPNHPVGAMPMIVDILTNQINSVDISAAKTLMKLICYHDLVGDVLGRGRDEQQIVDAVDGKEELDMLFAVGKADATSLVEQWWNQYAADELYGRCLAAI